MSQDDKTQTFNFLINQVFRIAKSATNRNDKLLKISKLLKDNISHYHWVGFYLADELKRELTLGPYSGEPTEHVQIPFGNGICGQAAEKKVTFVVQDVTKETNYLSCSPLVKSEIVVPILKGERIIGEIDVDSHITSPFTDDDRRFLENVSDIVSQLF